MNGPFRNCSRCCGFKPSVPGGSSKILGQAFVEPERHVFENAVEQGMRQFVPQILPHLVAPEGVDEQLVAAADGPRLSDEKRPSLWQIGIANLHEAVVVIAIFEEVDLDDCVRLRQLQFLDDLVAQIAEFGEEVLSALSSRSE